ncbi:twisted gastrulation protein homolog 1-A-like [Mya arenaria]|nr:twisted gastrulation protein homolog 1-A-like [Mya arenaria]
MRWTLPLVALVFVCVFYVGEACNQRLCPSLVSKCQLLKACDCDMTDKKNCSCCHNCQLCLSQLYSECCSCVEMCPTPKAEDTIGNTNTIEELPDPIPELFSVLTDEEDSEKRWTIHSYPVYYESLYTRFANNEKNKDNAHAHDVPLSHSINCTVAFMSKCMSAHKCKMSCQSMGAAKYRWTHHEGCCQCIGDTCIDYGYNKPLCLQCRGDDNDQMTETELEQEEDDIDNVNNEAEQQEKHHDEQHEAKHHEENHRADDDMKHRAESDTQRHRVHTDSSAVDFN